jgi:hypothetical protein
MADEQTEILLVGPPKPTIVNGLAAFKVHRLGEAKVPQALLADIAYAPRLGHRVPRSLPAGTLPRPL